MAREYRAQRGALWEAIFSHPKAATWIPVWVDELGANVEGVPDASAFEASDTSGAVVRALARRVVAGAPGPSCRPAPWARYQERVREAWSSFLEIRRRWGSHHTGLTIHILKWYRPPPFLYEDLVQDGHVGLMRALDSYDPERGTRFSTYAAWWIRNAILRGLERSREIHLPPKCVALLRQIGRASERLLAKGERPTAEALARETGSDLHQVEAALRAPRARRSQAAAPPRPAADPETLLSHAQLVEDLRRAAWRLEDRERRVIVQRFGLAGTPARTLADVGDELGVTPERARQIQVKGLTRLERALAERQVAV